MAIMATCFVRACLLVVLLVSCVCAKTLVLVDTLDIQYTHSLFFKDLRDAGHQLEFSLINSNHLRLQSYGTWLYDNVAIMTTKSSSFGGAVDVKYLVEFVDAGHNVLVAAGSSVSDAIREFAAEMGADFLETGSAVRDHVSFSAGHGPSHILASQVTDVDAIIGESCTLPILYSGVGLTTAADSLLTTVALAASTSTVSHVDEQPTKVAGACITLATAMQTLYNARVSVTGSIDMFSDAFFTAKVRDSATGKPTSTGNAAFCRELALWTFKNKSVLRLDGFQHHREGQQLPPPLNTYTVNDMITIEADIWENRGREWLPRKSSSVVAKFVMLDPYIRLPMAHNNAGHYNLTVKAPDVYGVFKWVIDYKKPGYTFLHHEQVTPLRPFRHNEYPRFIVQAYPYYFTVMSLSTGFLIMITFVMFHKPGKYAAV